MRRTKWTVIAIVGAVWLAGGLARAYNPGTDSRADFVAGLATPKVTLLCEGGANEGNVCTDSAQCDPPNGACTGLADFDVVARGLLTLVSDTVLAQGGDPTGWYEETPAAPCLPEPAVGVKGGCENTGNSTLALTVEFTRNGKRFFFAEVFKDLPNGFTIEDLIVFPDVLYTGWVQAAVESVLSERFADPTNPDQFVKIRWGLLPPAAEAAVAAAVGAGPGQRVVLSRVDEVPICEDATACNHGGPNSQFSDHAGASDPLATARRYKVDIALVPGS